MNEREAGDFGTGLVHTSTSMRSKALPAVRAFGVLTEMHKGTVHRRFCGTSERPMRRRRANLDTWVATQQIRVGPTSLGIPIANINVGTEPRQFVGSRIV